LSIPDLYQAVWRHRVFVLVMTAALVGAVWFLTARQQKLYTASTLVRVVQTAKSPSDVIQSLDAGQRLAQTYAKIAKTRTIRNEIYDQLNGTVGLHRIDITASPVQDLELLTISATHPSPRLAAKIANAAPRALGEFVKTSSTPAEQVIVVERAGVPDTPSSPRLKLNLALALMLGLVFNSLLALLAEVLRDPLPDSPRLERLLNQPVLATVPKLAFMQPSRVERFKRSRGRRAKPPRRAAESELAKARELSPRVARATKRDAPTEVHTPTRGTARR
jgi:capsular polysaccharide biosynthesis protein